MNGFLAMKNRSSSITILLSSFYYPSFSFRLVSFSLPLQTFFFSNLFLSYSTVFHIPTNLNDIHPLFFSRSSSINKTQCMLLTDALGTIAFRQQFRVRSLSLNIGQVLRLISKSSVSSEVQIRQNFAAIFESEKPVWHLRYSEVRILAFHVSLKPRMYITF